MILNHDSAACILEKLESVQPFPVHIVNREGIIIGSSHPQRVGEERAAAREYLNQPSRPGQAPGGGEAEGAGAITGIVVRHRVVGAVELEGLLPRDGAYLSMARTISELLLEQEYLIREQNRNTSPLGDLLSILVGIHPKDSAKVIEDLQRMGVDLSVPRTTLFLQLSKMNILEKPNEKRGLVFDQKQYQYSVEQFLNRLSEYFPDGQDFVLSDVSEQNAVVLSVDRRKDPEANAAYLFELCRRLVNVAKADYCLVLHAVVGIHCSAFSDYGRQYEQLLLRLSSGRLLFPERNVFMGNSIVLGNIVTHSSKTVIRNIVFYVYGRLLKSKMSAILLETLKTYFECDLNMTVTAQRLYIHRNTLQHRFNKIEELTGFSIRTADGLLTLRLAMLSYNSLLAKDELFASTRQEDSALRKGGGGACIE